MDEMRRRFMRLAVKLTEEELEKKKTELVEWTRVRAENEHGLEAWAAEMKEEKKQKEAQILAAAGYANRAADIIEAREERRDVEVSDNFDAGNVVTVRLDTGEVVATRPCNDDERQMLLPKAPCEPGDHHTVDGVCQKCGGHCICESVEIKAMDCPIHGVLPATEVGAPEGGEETEEEGVGGDGETGDV